MDSVIPSEVDGIFPSEKLPTDCVRLSERLSNGPYFDILHRLEILLENSCSDGKIFFWSEIPSK